MIFCIKQMALDFINGCDVTIRMKFKFILLLNKFGYVLTSQKNLTNICIRSVAQYLQKKHVPPRFWRSPNGTSSERQ